MPAFRIARPACCLLLAIAVLGTVPTHTDSLPNGLCDASAREAALDFTLSDVNGNVVNLTKYKGNVIALNFWGTWCEPCKAEIPAFNRLVEKYGAKGFTLVSLSLDKDVEKVQAFAQRMGINHPIFMIGPDHAIDQAYAPRWGVPATVVIRRDGLICRRQVGTISERDFEKRLVELLRAPSTSH